MATINLPCDNTLIMDFYGRDVLQLNPAMSRLFNHQTMVDVPLNDEARNYIVKDIVLLIRGKYPIGADDCEYQTPGIVTGKNAESFTVRIFGG